METGETVREDGERMYLSHGPENDFVLDAGVDIVSWLEILEDDDAELISYGF